MESIAEIMKKEHDRLHGLLESMGEDRVWDSEALNILKWNLEKHFFIEEKAIFRLYEKIAGEEIDDIFKLLKEHGDLFDLLKTLEEEFTPELAKKFEELLDEHREFEDAVFYPKLDEVLNEQQKQEMISRAKEVLR